MNTHEMIQNLLFDEIEAKLDNLPTHLTQKIYSIEDTNQLKKLYATIIDCSHEKEINDAVYNVSSIFGKSALKYKQNYDAVIKWIAQEFRGKTLEIFGIESGKIVDVFTFEPVEIKLKTGRLDLMFRDDQCACFHCEEQRNMSVNDFLRSGVYHFQAVREFGYNLTDILLISGRPYKGHETIITQSGSYHPVLIDLTSKNGYQRLEEIKGNISQGEYDNLIELIFVPLYGNQKQDRKKLAENVIQYEIDLLKKDQIYEKLVIATLIMCNKILDKHILQHYYEEIKNMIDILEIAIEDGKKQGMQQGLTKGMLQDAREMVLEVLEEKLGVVPSRIVEKIKSISTRETLKGLLRQAVKCEDIQHFEGKLALATS